MRWHEIGRQDVASSTIFRLIHVLSMGSAQLGNGQPGAVAFTPGLQLRAVLIGWVRVGQCASVCAQGRIAPALDQTGDGGNRKYCHNDRQR